MLMRITWGRVSPGMWPDFEDEFRNQAYSTAEGLMGNWLSRDLNDAESIYTVTLWSDAESMRAWENSDARTHRAKRLSAYLVGEYSVSLCEVSYGLAVKDLPSVAS